MQISNSPHSHTASTLASHGAVPPPITQQPRPPQTVTPPHRDNDGDSDGSSASGAGSPSSGGKQVDVVA
jgi:hypothetical protein